MAKVSKNSTDPRTLRTRKLLRSALFDLLETRHFDAITVLEITEKAGLNAATFYLHYDDKWDMLNSVVAEIGAIIVAQPRIAFRLDNGESGVSPRLELKLFEHIAEYRDFYRLMLGRNGVPAVRDELQGQFQKIVRLMIEQLPHALAAIDVPPALVEHFYGAAYVGVIQWWLTSKTPIPPQQVAQWLWTLQTSASYSEVMALFTATPADDGTR